MCDWTLGLFSSCVNCFRYMRGHSHDVKDIDRYRRRTLLACLPTPNSKLKLANRCLLPKQAPLGLWRPERLVPVPRPFPPLYLPQTSCQKDISRKKVSLFLSYVVLLCVAFRNNPFILVERSTSGIVQCEMVLLSGTSCFGKYCFHISSSPYTLILQQGQCNLQEKVLPLACLVLFVLILFHYLLLSCLIINTWIHKSNFHSPGCLTEHLEWNSSICFMYPEVNTTDISQGCHGSR